MTTKVQQWGNSLAVRIPKAFAEELALGHDTPVELILEDGELVVRPMRQPKWTLEELLNGVTEENRHGEAEWGESVGGEAW